MKPSEFLTRFQARCTAARVRLTADQVGQIAAYFDLLARWNPTINLTGFSLDPPTDSALDRLLIEPLVAATSLGESPREWYDIGSGGGSPAIPFKIVHPQTGLTMIESRARKVAFLREAVRAVGLSRVRVEHARLETLTGVLEHPRVDLVTVRAVKLNRAILDSVYSLLVEAGQLFWFHSAGLMPTEMVKDSAFRVVRTVDLRSSNDARLTVLTPIVSRGTIAID